MNRTVSRPDLGDMRANHEDFFPETIANLKESLGERPMSSRRMYGLLARSRDVLGCASWFAPQSQLLHDCARLHGQAAHGCALVTASTPGESVAVTLGKEIVPVVCDEHARLGSVAEWADAWCAGLAARDEVTLAGMRTIPTDRFRNPQVQIDEYQYALADAMIAVKDDGDRCLAMVAKARKLWKQRTIAMKGAADIDAAMLDVLEALVAGEAASFNELLHRALTAHAKFWRSRRGAPRGWIAVVHLGLACLAHDRGIAIEVESPYMPRALIDRTFSPEPSLTS